MTAPTFEDRQFDREFSNLSGIHEVTVREYKERHGIKVLIKPEEATQTDMVVVYKPIREGDQITGYTPVEMNSSGSALLGAIAKGFLLTPMDSQDEPQAEPAKVEDTVEAQSTESVEQPESEGSGELKPPEPTKETTFVCDRKFANGKKCSKTYKTEGRFLAHIRDKHAT
jgi:hypothetical protein